MPQIIYITSSKFRRQCIAKNIDTFSRTVCLSSTQVINEVQSLGTCSAVTDCSDQAGSWLDGRTEEFVHMSARDSLRHRYLGIRMSLLYQILQQQKNRSITSGTYRMKHRGRWLCCNSTGTAGLRPRNTGTPQDLGYPTRLGLKMQQTRGFGTHRVQESRGVDRPAHLFSRQLISS